MRLINATTLHLSEFTGSKIPKYAILTHTWEEEEVSYQDWLSWEQTGDAAIGRRKGFQKIQGACRQALKNHLDWLWVDTNCIDKSSSAELSEAINSMYAWYRDSEICYGYLADVTTTDMSSAELLYEFSKSRWFTRGWTLQELLAPRCLAFYSSAWKQLGFKSGALAGSIKKRTGIDIRYLVGENDVHEASDSLKMSWLSSRETTRVEDMAYCMLGLFDINMPLLYGEGHKAFIRLQEEIIRSHQDHTIFCWEHDPEFVPPNWTSMLAPRPQVFADAGRYIRRQPRLDVLPYSVTNLGLSIPLPVLYTPIGVMAVLDAANGKRRTEMRSCVLLTRQHGQEKIFSRAPFPQKPVDIRISGLPLPRASLLIQSKPKVRLGFREIRTHNPLNDAIDFPPAPGDESSEASEEWPQPETKRFSISLFLDPSATNFFFPDTSHPGWSAAPERQGLLATRTITMSSTPPGAPWGSHSDSALSLLSRKTLWSAQGVKSYHTSLLKVEVSASSDVYYLFFAVDSTAAEPTWYCDIETEVGLVSKGIGWDEPLCSSATLDTWMGLAHLNWREKTSAQAGDGVQLTLGDALTTAIPGVQRPATLSRGMDIIQSIDRFKGP